VVQADDAWVSPGPDGQPQVQLYFFWSKSCPHCTAAHPHVLAMAAQRPWLRLHEIEVSRDREAAMRFEAMVDRFGAADRAGVPAFVFCGEFHVGWDNQQLTGTLLATRLDACRQRIAQGQSAALPNPEAGTGIGIPLLGEVRAETMSLPLLTLMLALLDAFNPCAFFVLLFLLSMLAHQRNRLRMSLIGAVFVAISGIMYFAFMAAWLNVFQLLGHIGWITFAAAVLAVLIGVVNVKDFFWFKRGVSLSITESGRLGIFRHARAVLDADRLPAQLLATAFLAVAANFYELLCTAGFPMVYTRVLTLSEPSAFARYAWLAVYNLIYVVPLAIIVALFVRKIGARKLSEREGRLLKLLSGLMMCGLGIVLLVAPERLGQPLIAFALIAVALGLTWIAARLAHRQE
jgi:cytochrome c biogenesis protein CcdA